MTTETIDRPIVPLGNTCPVDFTDLPPELVRYRDEGCEMAPTCLECPFPRCLKEYAGAKARHLRRLRDREILAAFKSGHTRTKELAGIFGVSCLTVRRALKKSGLDLSRRARKRRPKVGAAQESEVPKRRASRRRSRPAWAKRLFRDLRWLKLHKRRQI